MDGNQTTTTVRPLATTSSRRGVLARAAGAASALVAAGLVTATPRGLVRLVPWLGQHKDNPTLVGQHKDNPTGPSAGG